MFVPACISGPHPCASRVTSLIFAFSHSSPSLLLRKDGNSDILHASLLMAEPAKWRGDLKALELSSSNVTACYTRGMCTGITCNLGVVYG